MSFQIIMRAHAIIITLIIINFRIIINRVFSVDLCIFKLNLKFFFIAKILIFMLKEVRILWEMREQKEGITLLHIF